MEIKDLLKKFKENNLDISLSGDNLQLHSDSPDIDPLLIAQIREHKQAIVGYLKRNSHDKEDLAPIPRIEEADNYPMSSSQRRLWILSQFEEGGGAYNMFKSHMFEGKLDKEVMQKAMNTLIDRHEILRTVFKEDDKGEIKQYIKGLKEINFAIEYFDLRNDPGSDKSAKDLIQAQIHTNFDISTGPLFNASLIHLSDNCLIFTYVMHHIIGDGWSMRVMMKELLLVYNSYLKNNPVALKPLRIQYKDYAAWQQAQLTGEQLQLHKTYWLKQFEGTLPVLDLQTDRVRPAVKTFNGKKIRTTINEELSGKLKLLNQEQGATLFMGLLATVNVLLYHYSSQEDLIIGSPIAGRSHSDLEDQIGFYVNTLALRTRLNVENSFRKLLAETKRLTLDAFEHQVYPFDELVDELQINRDMSRNVLFDVMVVLQNTGMIGKIEEAQLIGLEIKESEDDIEHVVSKFDLTFDFVEHGDCIDLTIEYNSDLFDDSSIYKMTERLETLLGSIIAAPDEALKNLHFITEEEKKLVLVDFNSSVVGFKNNKTIIDLFDEQALKNQESIAVVSGENFLTYSALKKQSECLAAYIKQELNLKNARIAIRLQRSDRMIVAILGVLKSGNSYIPIDPAYPEERISYMLEDSKCSFVIDEDEFSKINFNEAFSAELEKIDPTSPAYIIYTSGSTGNPKGVVVCHSAIANTILSQKQVFGIREKERGLQFASISFDASLWEIFAMLCFGGTLYIISDEEKKDPILFENFIQRNNIGFATLPPAYLKLLTPSHLKTIRTLITAGEPAIAEDIVKFLPFGNYYNAYGPTETSICASVHKVTKEDVASGKAIPIGKPLPNVQIYILDGNNRLVPPGFVGEICIGGKGLANGYADNTVLTAEKFIVNPFVTDEVIYKTGDYGKWLADGVIEFTGRKDSQVKIRGYRIELGEIEKAILNHPNIKAVKVIARANTEKEKYLCAFLVSQEELVVYRLKQHLTKTLPAFMIPEHFIVLDALPLTSNGKIDDKKLANLDENQLFVGVDYLAPSDKTEEMLVDVYSEILGRAKNQISVLDNFFDLGGNSLKIIKMNKKINFLFKRKDPVSIMFIYPTIKDLAVYIKTNKGDNQMSDALIDTAVDDLENSMLAFNELNNEDDE